MFWRGFTDGFARLASDYGANGNSVPLPVCKETLVTAFNNPGHLIAIVILVVATIIIVPLVRTRPGKWVTALSWTIGSGLIINLALWQIITARSGNWAARSTLPLDLCDIAAVVVAVTLFWPHTRLVEISWFWALAGTVQAIITPSYLIEFPSYDWVQFYGGHCGIVFGAVMLVLGRGIHPQRGAIRRVVATTIGVTAAVGAADVITGGNYMFLRHVPGAGSALDLLGPWPWYIVGATGTATALITALDLPFWPERRGRRRTAARTSAAVPA